MPPPLVYCSKLSFCQNDSPMEESFWQKEIHDDSAPMLQRLCFTYPNVECILDLNFSFWHLKLKYSKAPNLIRKYPYSMLSDKCFAFLPNHVWQFLDKKKQMRLWFANIMAFTLLPLPPIYLHLIFEILQFIKLKISNWRMSKIKCR